MARLAAVEKGEYYPTPLTIVEQISQYVVPKQTKRSGTIRLLDPCAGKGRALEALGNRFAALSDHPIETWGVEISEERAAAAAERLDKVIAAPFQAVNWSPWGPGAASLLFLNPPYDRNAYGGRMETSFLKVTTPALVSNGVLVLIIPAKSVNYSLSSYLFQQYKDVQLFRFGGAGKASFEQFKQVVILARKRREAREKYSVATRDDQKAFREQYAMAYPRSKPERYMQDVPDSLPSGTTYEVRPTRTMARLRRYRWLPGEVEEIVETNWEQVESTIGDQLLTTHQEIEQPLMPLSVGNIARVTAAGLTGVLEGEGAVYTGREVKDVKVVPDLQNPDRVIEQEFWTTHVVQVTPEGLEHMKKPPTVKDFLQDRIDTFEEILGQTLIPYGNDVSPAEQAILDTLSLDKKLPNADKAGLMPHQRESSVAITRALDKYGACFVVGEMGYGKSRVSLAATEVDGRYPALVVTPPQVIKKWKEEEAEPSIPGAQAYIAESITELEEVREKHEPGDKTVVIVPRSYFKLGPGWEKKTSRRKYLANANDDEITEEEQRRRKAFHLAYAEYERLRDRLDKADGDASALRAEVKQAREAALGIARDYSVCPRCGKPTGSSRGQTICDGTREVWDDVEQTMVEVPCGEALYQFGTRYHRWPLADYIHKKMRGFFEVFIVDEVHQYKSRSSDQGRMFRLLAYHMDTVALTGTLSGGKSTDIFALLYAMLPQVREDYAWDDVKRWVQRFGVEETTWKVGNAAEVRSYGALLGTKRQKVSTKERPGINPGIVKYLLPVTIFAHVEDLGLDMPPIYEKSVRLQPTPRMERDLGGLHRFTWDQLVEWWPHYTSAWLQWNLARPNSGYRTELVSGYQAAPDSYPDGLSLQIGVAYEGSLFRVAQEVIEIPQDDLVAELRKGQSMADVARAYGVNENVIIREFLAPFQAKWERELEAAAEDDDVDGRKLQKVHAKKEAAITYTLMTRLTWEQDATFTPPPELLPKEEWLVNTVLAEIKAGRRSVLYVRQTGTRDIRDRLRRVLEDAGVGKILVLDSSVDPRDRGDLLKDSTIDVLITNPKLVETGLDLVEFQNVIFYEPNYSAYTMWQACRRVWRPGQTEPVQVYYAMYEGHMEEGAYDLVGEKLLHAQLLHGDDASGALVPADGSVSLTMALIDALKRGDRLRMKGDTIFTDSPGEVVSVSVSGSMTHQSKEIPSLVVPQAIDPDKATQLTMF